MKSSSLVVLGIIGFALSALPTSGFRAVAGEVEGGFSGCRLDDVFSACKWKASQCYKPSAPVFFSFSRDAYNAAVDQYNDYVRRVQEYENCIIAEGKHDIADSFPNLVAKGAKEQIEAANDEVTRARSQLQLIH